MSYDLLDHLDLSGKAVLVRLDLNVPLSEGRITDQTRLERSLPTVSMLRQRGARVTICTHLGRPKGKVVPQLSLSVLIPAICEILGETVTLRAIGETSEAPLTLLENLRFDPREEKNDPLFAQELARGQDLFISDAFSCAHRAHASTHAIAKILPSYAGPLMHQEISALSQALSTGKRPMVALVGGAKVSSKLMVLENLVNKVDYLIIGGGMANTFLAAQGVEIGRSLCEHDLLVQARAIQEKASLAGCKIILPQDAQVATACAPDAQAMTVPIDQVPQDMMILDIGAQSSAEQMMILSQAATLLWNGPLGVFECPPFDMGTVAVARYAADCVARGSLGAIAGGGDTIAALKHAEVLDKFTYVSTAGGAFLEWLEGKELPGVKVLAEQA